MADIKKRPLADDQEMGISKKRAVSSITDTPVPLNGKIDASREELNADNIETFRKEAIYRRMKHYSRENERAQDQIAELEKRRDALEANVAAIGACWEQLIQEVRLLVNPQSLPTSDELIGGFFDLTGDEAASSLSESLRDRGRTTQELIATFVSLGPRAPYPDDESLRRQCSNLQSQVSVLRAQVSVANARIAKTESEKDRYYTNLVAAEARADRARSASTQTVRIPSAISERTENKRTFKGELKEEEGDMPLPTPGSPQSMLPNGNGPPVAVPDDLDWKSLYENCDKRNKDMAEELQQLKVRCSNLMLQLASPSLDIFQKSPYYESLMQRLQYFRHDSETYKQKCAELTPQVDQLRELQEDFKEKLIADYNVRYDEQKNLIIKRDHENVRLREQRDTLQAELNEMKTRSAEKKSTAQLQILLQSRADRITALELESKRLKSYIAANAGDENLLELLLDDKLKDLPERLRTCERKLEALHLSLATLDHTHPDVTNHIRSESEAREALAVALSRLERFDSIFGSGSVLPPSQQTMAKQLQEKEELLRVANLQRQQEKIASNDLFSEIERLSAAWEALDRQNKAKVFDMDAMDVKLQKLAGEKAKADNKYFGAMRQKEAAEAERKASSRTVEKLQRTVERLSEAEKGFGLRLATQEKEITLHKNRGEILGDRLIHYERQVQEHRWSRDHDQKLLADVRNLSRSDSLAQEKHHRAEARRFEEENIRARKEAERQFAKVNAVASGNVTTREIDLEQKYEKCMKLLRCSTCKQGLRSHVLTKCMHTFCKDCIQARIDTRQRKCPACNMGFSQSEFQQLYFQG
ncbi:BRE1-domain-containing protein [Ramaria rubella]|nr:BRE1-domain-containing protein [Ramaria rubella]